MNNLFVAQMSYLGVNICILRHGLKTFLFLVPALGVEFETLTEAQRAIEGMNGGPNGLGELP